MDNKEFRKLIVIEDYFCGYNSKGKFESHLVVYELGNKEYATEYDQFSNQKWKCIGCKSRGDNNVCAKIVNGDIHVPVAVAHRCIPRKVEEILEEQRVYRNLWLYGDGIYNEQQLKFYNKPRKFDKYDVTEYRFGINHVQRPDSRLIVTHKTDKQFVYHFVKNSGDKQWHCHKCEKEKKKVYGAFINEIFYIPTTHRCEPIDVSFSNIEQASWEAEESIPQHISLYQKYEEKMQKISKNDYIFGSKIISETISEEHYIFICEYYARDLIHEYTFKHDNVWQCMTCKKKNFDSFAIMIDGKLNATLRHGCEVKKYRQTIIKNIQLLYPIKSQKEIDDLIAEVQVEMPRSKVTRLSMSNQESPSPSDVASLQDGDSSLSNDDIRISQVTKPITKPKEFFVDENYLKPTRKSYVFQRRSVSAEAIPEPSKRKQSRPKITSFNNSSNPRIECPSSSIGRGLLHELQIQDSIPSSSNIQDEATVETSPGAKITHKSIVTEESPQQSETRKRKFSYVLSEGGLDIPCFSEANRKQSKFDDSFATVPQKSLNETVNMEQDNIVPNIEVITISDDDDDDEISMGFPVDDTANLLSPSTVTENSSQILLNSSSVPHLTSMITVSNPDNDVHRNESSLEKQHPLIANSSASHSIDQLQPTVTVSVDIESGDTGESTSVKILPTVITNSCMVVSLFYPSVQSKLIAVSNGIESIHRVPSRGTTSGELMPIASTMDEEMLTSENENTLTFPASAEISSTTVTNLPDSHEIFLEQPVTTVSSEDEMSYEDESTILLPSMSFEASSINVLSPAAASHEESSNDSSQIKIFVKQSLQKLNIQMGEEIIQFFDDEYPCLSKAHFNFPSSFFELSPDSIPGKCYSISSAPDSFFKSLSCFFAGSEKYYVPIKCSIQGYFFNNYKTFGTIGGINFTEMSTLSIEFLAVYNCTFLSDVHFAFISNWLKIRIGIFINDKLQRYGKWDDEKAPILLFQNSQGFYKPVLSIL